MKDNKKEHKNFIDKIFSEDNKYGIAPITIIVYIASFIFVLYGLIYHTRTQHDALEKYLTIGIGVIIMPFIFTALFNTILTSIYNFFKDLKSKKNKRQS